MGDEPIVAPPRLEGSPSHPPETTSAGGLATTEEQNPSGTVGPGATPEGNAPNDSTSASSGDSHAGQAGSQVTDSTTTSGNNVYESIQTIPALGGQRVLPPVPRLTVDSINLDRLETGNRNHQSYDPEHPFQGEGIAVVQHSIMKNYSYLMGDTASWHLRWSGFPAPPPMEFSFQVMNRQGIFDAHTEGCKCPSCRAHKPPPTHLMKLLSDHALPMSYSAEAFDGTGPCKSTHFVIGHLPKFWVPIEGGANPMWPKWKEWFQALTDIERFTPDHIRAVFGLMSEHSGIDMGKIIIPSDGYFLHDRLYSRTYPEEPQRYEQTFSDTYSRLHEILQGATVQEMSEVVSAFEEKAREEAEQESGESRGGDSATKTASESSRPSPPSTSATQERDGGSAEDAEVFKIEADESDLEWANRTEEVDLTQIKRPSYLPLPEAERPNCYLPAGSRPLIYHNGGYDGCADLDWDVCPEERNKLHRLVTPEDKERAKEIDWIRTLQELKHLSDRKIRALLTAATQDRVDELTMTYQHVKEFSFTLTDKQALKHLRRLRHDERAALFDLKPVPRVPAELIAVQERLRGKIMARYAPLKNPTGSNRINQWLHVQKVDPGNHSAMEVLDIPLPKGVDPRNRTRKGSVPPPHSQDQWGSPSSGTRWTNEGSSGSGSGRSHDHRAKVEAPGPRPVQQPKGKVDQPRQEGKRGRSRTPEAKEDRRNRSPNGRDPKKKDRRDARDNRHSPSREEELTFRGLKKEDLAKIATAAKVLGIAPSNPSRR